ncbi:MAG TPA: hypothetical protein VIK91_05295, partial [Nannocystis sp.]
PCDLHEECSPAAPRCIQGLCRDGSEGDPCNTDTDCSMQAPACVNFICYDGSYGDPCDYNSDCQHLLFCDNGLCF